MEQSLIDGAARETPIGRRPRSRYSVSRGRTSSPVCFEFRKHVHHSQASFADVQERDVLIVFAEPSLPAERARVHETAFSLKGESTVCVVPGLMERQAKVESSGGELLHLRVPHCVLDETASALGISYRPDCIKPAFFRRDPHLATLGANLMAILEDAGTLEGPLVDTYARAFAGFILSQYAVEGSSGSRPARGGLSARALERVRREIEDSPEADFSVERLAGVAGVSVFHFCREFKRSTGRTPFQHIVEARCRKAMRQLEGTDERITDIALSCGFGSSQSFARAFRRVVGVSPSEFRQSSAPAG